MVEHLPSMHEIPDSMPCAHAHARMQTHTRRQKKSYNAVVNEKITGVITLESVVLEGLSNQIGKGTDILSGLREGHG